VQQTASPTPADRLALIIEGLCQAVARRCGLNGLAAPFIILIWTRLRRIATRFTRAALTPAQPGIVPNCPQPVIASGAKQSRGRSKPGSPPPLPRRKAWLLRLVPDTAANASQLRHFLVDPEVAILLATTPRLTRILRPLCHALGIRATAIPAASIRPDQAPPPPLPPAAAPSWPPPPRLPDLVPPPLPFQQRHALPEPLATPPLWHDPPPGMG
jgi:hypothetical protein